MHTPESIARIIGTIVEKIDLNMAEVVTRFLFKVAWQT